MFGGEPTHALDKAAFNLAHVQTRVDAAPNIVQDVYAQHAAFSGQGVNGHFGARSAIGEIVKRPTSERGFVVVDFGRAVKTVAPQLNPIGIRHLHHLIKAAGGFGGDDLASAKFNCASATTVQAADKGRQVIAHMARGKLRSPPIQVGARRGRCGRGVRNGTGVAGAAQHTLKRNA